MIFLALPPLPVGVVDSCWRKMLQLFVDVCSGFPAKLCALVEVPGLLFLTLVKAVEVGVGVFFPVVEVRGLVELEEEVTY